MGQDIGNVGYDAEAALYAGAVFPEYEKPECCKPELLLVPMDGSSADVGSRKLLQWQDVSVR